MLTQVIKPPKNIELVYHGDSVEYIKDNDPGKPLTLAEKLLCDEVVKLKAKTTNVDRSVVTIKHLEKQWSNDYGLRKEI